MGTLPRSLRVLDLPRCRQFNHLLGCLPLALRELRLGAAFNQPLLHAPLPAAQGQQAAAQALCAGLAAEPLQPPPDTLVRLPETLTELHVGEAFDHPLGPLPESLTELQVGGCSGDSCFSHALGPLPAALRILDLGVCAAYNHALYGLPDTLRSVCLGHMGDQPLLHFPARLEVLALGDSFDAALPAVLPRTLRELYLGNRFNAPLTLPPGLNLLAIGDRYPHRLDLAALPLKKLYLRVGRCSCDCCFSHALGPLPAALRILDLSTCAMYNHALSSLPDTLRELRLDSDFDQPLPQLNACLEVLALGDAFDAALPAVLPRALRELHWGNGFNAPLTLPPRLKVLTIGISYTHRLDLAALSLKELRVGRSYANALPPLEVLTLSSGGYMRLNLTLGALPHSLETLDTTCFANFSSALGQLPESITCLNLGASFNQALEALPAALTELRIHNGTPWGNCSFNKPLGTVPPSLRTLDLDQCCRFNHLLGRLPRTLRKLRLGAAFNQPL
ncbi:hypothetical protein JKP88DRAFT_160059, partial [Tribonema minus]